MYSLIALFIIHVTANGRRQSTSCNCVELEQMLKQTLFYCFLSFTSLFSLFHSLPLFRILTVVCVCVYGTQLYLAHLASKPACPWTCCYHNRTMNCTKLLFHTTSKQRNNISKFTDVTFYSPIVSIQFGLFSYLVSYYCNKLREN